MFILYWSRLLPPSKSPQSSSLNWIEDCHFKSLKIPHAAGKLVADFRAWTIQVSRCAKKKNSDWRIILQSPQILEWWLLHAIDKNWCGVPQIFHPSICQQLSVRFFPFSELTPIWYLRIAGHCFLSDMSKISWRSVHSSRQALLYTKKACLQT